MDTTALLERIESRLGTVGAAFAFALVIEIATLWIAVPGWHPRALTFVPLCQDPFTHERLREPLIQHRILGPLIAYALGLRGESGLAIPVLANLPLLAVVFLCLRRRLGVRTAFLGAALVGTTLATLTSQSWLGYSDSLASLGVALALLIDHPALGAATFFVGLFADERAATVVPLIVLWHDTLSPGARRWWIRAGALAGAVLAWAAVATLFPSRHETGRHIAAVLEGHFVGPQLPFVPAGIFLGLRAAWLFPALLVARWARRAGAFRCALLLGAVACVVVPGALVDDISRGASLAFPAVMLALCVLAREGALDEAVLTVALVLNFAPAYQSINTKIEPVTGVPLLVVRKISDIRHGR